MNFWKLVLSMVICKTECLLEVFLICLEINSSFNKAILKEELSSFFRSHILSYFDCNLSKLFSSTISFCNSKSVFPIIMCSVHINSKAPSTTLNIVMLCLFKVSFHFQTLSKMLVSILEEIFSEFHD
jgi:hypothetical protein